MTNEQIISEAKKEFEQFEPICTTTEETWTMAYQLAYKRGQTNGMIQATNNIKDGLNKDR